MKKITQFEKADMLYDDGKFKEALNIFRKIAKNGDDSAMDRIGTMYANGEGVEKNISKAIEWYKKSVVNGGLTSLYNLGLIYKCENNINESKRWFTMALNEGDTDASVELAKLYLDNDVNKAISYLKIALLDDNLILDVKEEAESLLRSLGT
jgi:TPR repeat protein